MFSHFNNPRLRCDSCGPDSIFPPWDPLQFLVQAGSSIHAEHPCLLNGIEHPCLIRSKPTKAHTLIYICLCCSAFEEFDSICRICWSWSVPGQFGLFLWREPRKWIMPLEIWLFRDCQNLNNETKHMCLRCMRFCCACPYLCWSPLRTLPDFMTAQVCFLGPRFLLAAGRSDCLIDCLQRQLACLQRQPRTVPTCRLGARRHLRQAPLVGHVMCPL